MLFGHNLPRWNSLLHRFWSAVLQSMCSLSNYLFRSWFHGRPDNKNRCIQIHTWWHGLHRHSWIILLASMHYIRQTASFRKRASIRRWLLYCSDRRMLCHKNFLICNRFPCCRYWNSRYRCKYLFLRRILLRQSSFQESSQAHHNHRHNMFWSYRMWHCSTASLQWWTSYSPKKLPCCIQAYTALDNFRLWNRLWFPAQCTQRCNRSDIQFP